MEHHMSTTVSLFRLWIARGKDISQEELFQLIHIIYHDGYLGLIKEKNNISKTYSFPKSHVSYRKPGTAGTEQRERARQMMIARNRVTKIK